MVRCSIISPSYFCSEEEKKNVEKNLKKLGFHTIENYISSNKFFDKWGGSPNKRLMAFNKSWNSTSRIIFCCKGGSGVSHFLPLIKEDKLIKKKLLVGYSDITLLLNFLSETKNVISIHGPNLHSDLNKTNINSLKKAIQMKDYGIKIKKANCYNFKKNVFRGKTIGGNLERIVELSLYKKINYRNKIVFLEETKSSEHKIFNLLCSLKNNHSFKPKVIIFGTLDIKNKKLIKKMILHLFPKTPFIFSDKFGHNKTNIAIPINTTCEVNLEKNIISFRFSKKDKSYSINF